MAAQLGMGDSLHVMTLTVKEVMDSTPVLSTTQRGSSWARVAQSSYYLARIPTLMFLGSQHVKLPGFF